MGRGMVEGRVLYTDSTHLKANANKNKHDVLKVAQTPVAYLAELEAAIDADRQASGKKPLKGRGDDENGDGGVSESDKTKQIKVSRTDPDSGFMVRNDKPRGFFYLDHRTVDGKHAIITDTHVTPGNVHDSQLYLSRLDRQCECFGFAPDMVGLDAGYFTSQVCHGLERREIAGVMGYRRPPHREGYFYKRQYVYDEAGDRYICPSGQELTYRATSREGYRQYHSDPTQCASCEDRPRCTRSVNQIKVVVCHVWEAAKEAMDARRLTEWGKRVYARRKETVERSFADAKQLHGCMVSSRYVGIPASDPCGGRRPRRCAA